MKPKKRKGRKGKFLGKSAVIALRVPECDKDFWKKKFERQLMKLQKAS